MSQSSNWLTIAGSHNVLAVEGDDHKFVEETSLKTKWNGGAARDENLRVALEKSGPDAPSEVTIRVNMRDPGIVNPGEATNLVENLQLSWDPAR